ncbi:MAG: Smr/MutS family protein [Alphaproteobacteria bacterium]|nr:Smr/MutS family protein [Alphaproteobacteria bacterium]
MNLDGKRRGSRDSRVPPHDITHTEDSESLWVEVTRGVTPLHKNTVASVPVPAKTPRSRALRESAETVPAATRSQGVELDRRTAQKLRRGRYPIDRQLDLHGLTQSAAHKKLLETVGALYQQGGRCLLVITGKGKGAGSGTGILRQRVPEWLAHPALRSVVLRLEEAQPEHGGSGALYVLLRRNRKNGAESDKPY